MKAYLSKSKILSWLQCPRRLWLEVHQPELAEVSDVATAIMANGNVVGEVARSLHPGGILIERQSDLSAATRQTQALVSAKPPRPLFEATFSHDGLLVRNDILVPEKRSWRLIEVKSSTSVKDYHLQDAAIQCHVLEQAGVRLVGVEIQYINKEFVYPGKGIYHQVKRNGKVNSLFAQQDVSTEIRPRVKKEVPKWIEGARSTLAGKMPKGSDNCHEPFDCPFTGYCHPQTTDYPIERLPRIKAAQAEALRAQGYGDIRQIPAGVLKNKQHERVRTITVSGKAQLLPGAAKSLKALPYPRYYLDFETIQFAVPIWEGTRPYQQLPFQWSCHVERKNGRLNHFEFLDTSGMDPTRDFAEQLIATVGKSGSVIVYNQGFEGRVIKELAARYHDLAPALHAISDRLVDLLPITRDHYYHPDMLGSWSIKSVLRTIAPGLDYSQLEDVQDGGQAQVAYLEAIAYDTPKERRTRLNKALHVYCRRDTEAMVRIVRLLQAGTCDDSAEQSSASPSPYVAVPPS